MTKYIKKQFEHAWQAAKFIEEGGKLYMMDSGHAYDVGVDTAMKNLSALFIEEKRGWRERLDGTTDNGVLCFVWDETRLDGRISMVVEVRDCRFRFLCESGNAWQNAEPLTRAEIMELAERAPEE